ncbi:MAG: cobalamin-dependent protein [bacterium]
MKIKFISVEEGITALGFRKVVSVARELNLDTEIYFITTGNLYSLKTHLFPSTRETFTYKDYKKIAKKLSDSDLICFSSMTPSAFCVERIVKYIRKYNPKAFILWGGTHTIINPEDAIKHVDAICTGEGEAVFANFYRAFLNKKNYLKTKSMWFKKGRKLYKNSNLPLNEPEKLASFPHLYYGLDCEIYDLKKGIFREFTKRDFLNFNGLSYRTVWTIGCPFSCIYCANDAFIRYDCKYRIIRFSPVDHMLDEIVNAINIYPFISTVVFYDDNFIAIPVSTLKEFVKKYKKRVGLPFAVSGLHPNFITKEKMDILGKAGMNRGRMGIQSASERILAFYQRPTPLPVVRRSANILADMARKYRMIPPSYDIIIDNPIEEKKDLVDSLRFLYKLKRPYTLTIFSLRVFPKTRLWDYFQSHPSTDIRQLTSSYLDTRKTVASVLFYMVSVARPPKFIFEQLLKKVNGHNENKRFYPTLYWLAKMTYLVSRGLSHLKRLDFTTIVGPYGYYLWKVGLVRKN